MASSVTGELASHPWRTSPLSSSKMSSAKTASARSSGRHGRAVIPSARMSCSRRVLILRPLRPRGLPLLPVTAAASRVCTKLSEMSRCSAPESPMRIVSAR